MIRRQRPDSPDERGAILITVALLLIPLLAMASIVIDLGTDYASSRQMQNSADTASLAATRQLAQVKYSGADPATVDAVAHSIAVANGADYPRVTCIVILADQTPLGPCSTAANITTKLAAGVQVTAAHQFPTAFGYVIGINKLTPNRVASATIQSMLTADGLFLVCAFNQTDGSVAVPDLLLNQGANYIINPAAIGQNYFIHGPHVSNCGLGSQAWKGNAGTGPFTLPGTLPISTGVKAGPVRDQIAGHPGCVGTYNVGCTMLLPICSSSDGGSGINGHLNCDTFGAFQLFSQTANTHTFTFLGAATAISGQGSRTLPGPNNVQLIKLVQ
jgi:Flp pilus assembly protein TadG